MVGTNLLGTLLCSSQVRVHWLQVLHSSRPCILYARQHGLNICCATQGFLDTTPEQLQQVVGTNLLGTLLCSRRAMRLMAAQPRGGHLFNLDGAGADGLATPCYAAYGATKAGVQAQARDTAV